MSVFVTVRDIDDIREVVQALINEAIEKHEIDLTEEFESRLEEAQERICVLEEALQERNEIIEELNQQVRDLHLELQGLDE